MPKQTARADMEQALRKSGRKQGLKGQQLTNFVYGIMAQHGFARPKAKPAAKPKANKKK